MNNMFICPKCKCLFVGEGESKHLSKCPECGARILLLGCSEAEWDSKTNEEKAEYKQNFLSRLASNENLQGLDERAILLSRMEQIERHLSTIKGILVFFLIVSIVSAVVTLFF